jgi:hypothetical protein
MQDLRPNPSSATLALLPRGFWLRAAGALLRAAFLLAGAFGMAIAAIGFAA